MAKAESVWASELPDHLDHQKHEQIYKEAKNVSDRERLLAEQIQSEWQAHVREKDRVEGLISSHGETISNHQRGIEQFKNKNLYLQSEIEKLRSEIPSLEATYKSNQSRMGALESERTLVVSEGKNLQSRFQEVTGELNQQERQVRSIERERENMAQHLGSINQSIDYIESDTSQKSRERSNNEIRIFRIQSYDIPQARREKQAARQRHRRQKETVANLEGTRKEVSRQVLRLEEDFQRAEQKVQRERRAVAPVRRALKQSRKEARESGNQFKRAQAQYAKLESEVEGFRQRHNGMHQQVQTKTQNKKQFEEQVKSVTRRIIKHRQAVKVLTHQHESKKEQINRLKSNTSMDPKQKKKKLEQLQGEARRIQKDLELKKSRLQKSRLRRKKIGGKISKLAVEIQGLRESLKDIESQIQGKEREKQQVALVVQKKQAAWNVAKQNEAQAKRRWDRDSEALKQAKVEKEAVRANLDSVKSRFTALEREYTQASKDLSRARRKLERARTHFVELENEMSNLIRRNQELNRRLVELEGELRRAKENLRYAQQQLQEVESRLLEARRIEEGIRLRKNEIEQKVADNSAKEGFLTSEIDRFSQENLELKNKVAKHRSTIVSHRDSMGRNRVEVERLTGEIFSLEASVSNLKEQVVDLDGKIFFSQAQFEGQDKVAQRAESITVEKLARYKEAKGAFDAILHDAQVQGRLQGRKQGPQNGYQQGFQDGAIAGEKQGHIIGTGEGLIFGYNEGHKDGVVKGEKDGYKRGFETPSHHEAGVEAGRTQGLADAQVEAQKTNYPEGRRYQRSQRMMQLPKEEITLDNSPVQVQGDLRGDFQGLTNLFPMGAGRNMNRVHGVRRGEFSVGEFSSSEWETRVSQLHPLLSSEEGENESCVAIPGVIVPKFEVPPNSVRCEFQYSVFNNACKASFGEFYQSTYMNSYQGAHSKSMVASCEESRETAFEENKTLRYQEGYNEAYPVAFAKGETMGAKDAHKEGFVLGKKQGFEENIEEQRKVFFQKGQDDENKYFDHNAVVQMQSASVRKISSENPNIIVAGDELMLDIKMANFGLGSTNHGDVKARVEALTSSFLVPSQGWIDLVSLSGDALIHVLNALKVQVRSDVAKNHVAQLKVTLRNSEGDFNYFILDIPIRAQIRVNVKNKDSWSLRPEIGRRVRLKIKVTNISDISGISHLQLSWSVKDKKKASWIRFRKPSPIQISASMEHPFRPNESRFVKIYYTVRSYMAGGQKIPMNFQVTSGGLLLGKTMVILRPNDDLNDGP